MGVSFAWDIFAALSSPFATLGLRMLRRFAVGVSQLTKVILERSTSKDKSEPGVIVLGDGDTELGGATCVKPDE